MTKSLQRIAVLNRGEPAVRFIRALQEYNLERGTQLQAIAFYTTPDTHAPFVLMADEAHALGEPLLADASGSMVSAYCHHDHVIETLKKTRCDAVWPGWGFVSEDMSFVARLEQEDIIFLGPSSHAMGLLGDKVESKHLASQSDVPLAPWTMIDPEADPKQWQDDANTIGFPLVVKASAGGGGRGIRRVDEPAQLIGAVRAVADEVRKVFGAGTLFMEACIEGARHIEVQLVSDPDAAMAVGIRDCSMQRRNQKVIEEAPSPILPQHQDERLRRSTEALLEEAKYHGVATAEFLYDPKKDELYFLEVNSRLQVEHTITEMITGCDLVHAQIDIARGLPWHKPEGAERGHAIEVRLNAEDPEQNFRPSPGIVRVFDPPSGPGVRVDSGVVEGLAIAPEFDSMVAKVITWGPTRTKAIARMIRALNELKVIVEDGAVNKDFLLELLEHPKFVDGSADTAWIDRAMRDGQLAQPKFEVEALLAAAIIEYRRHQGTERRKFFTQAQNGIPQQLGRPEGLSVELKLRGRTHKLDVYEIGLNRFLVGPEDHLQQVIFDETKQYSAILTHSDQHHQVLYTYGRSGMSVELNGATHTVELASGGVVKAPAPAMVVHVAAEPGDTVNVGDTLCTLEAMKMEMPVFAQAAGVVKEVLILANQQVTAGQPLLIMELENNTGEQAVQTTSWQFPEATNFAINALFDAHGNPQPQWLDRMEDTEAKGIIDELCQTLEGELLGYDQCPELQQKSHGILDALNFDYIKKPERWHALSELLFTFIDGQALFERTLLPVTDAPSSLSTDAAFYEYCRHLHEGEDGARAPLRPLLKTALSWYGVHQLDPSDELRQALWRLATRHRHADVPHHICSSVLRAMMGMHAHAVSFTQINHLERTLDTLARVVDVKKYPFLADNARQASYVLLSQSRYVERQSVIKQMLRRYLDGVNDSGELLAINADAEETLVDSPHSIMPLLLGQSRIENPTLQLLLARVIARRLYQLPGEGLTYQPMAGKFLMLHTCNHDTDANRAFILVRTPAVSDHVESIAKALQDLSDLDSVDIALLGSKDAPAVRQGAIDALTQIDIWKGLGVEDVTFTWSNDIDIEHLHCVVDRQGIAPSNQPDIHPNIKTRFELHRLNAFALKQLHAPETIYAYSGKAHDNPKDERIFVFAEITDLPESLNDESWRERLLDFERTYFEALKVIRDAQAHRSPRNRLHWNLITLFVRPTLHLSKQDITYLAKRFESKTAGLGIRKIVIRAKVPDEQQGTRAIDIALIKPGRHRLNISLTDPDTSNIDAMTAYEMRVVRTRRWRMFYPYEVIRMLEGQSEEGLPPHPDLKEGRFQEYDLNDEGQLVEVLRPYGQNTCGVVIGTVSNPTKAYPEGIKRMWIGSDPTFAMGALAEQECTRIMAAIDMAEANGLPIEWLPISAGARISMDSGTENLDWTAAVLRRIVEFTQKGGEINIIVSGVNVGAQSYWNAEATMLMHTRGILIMTPDGSMVLTGKKALDYSGSVSAEDERGIGGYERIMGQNGQAQYFANDLGEAYALLMNHYRFTYKRADEVAPRRITTTDPKTRSILSFPYTPINGETFSTVGEIFSVEQNADRKKPFAIREVMKAVIDQDSEHEERFKTMKYGETAVVWDAHVGGFPVCLIGVESRPQPRHGRVPVDGPDTWTGGTLFPQSSKKVARALNAASGNRPAVVLANLSGFDGSPESLRKLQLEYGAEIGRAVVNFDGPIVFVVIGRYHGGAYVVFSKALNPNLTAYALEGTFASVIGGAPAAAVVFGREVIKQTENDPRILEARRALNDATSEEKPLLRERHDTLYAKIKLEKQGELAQKFDSVHNVQRAVEVGSLDAVIQAERLRPTIIETLEQKQHS